MSYLWRIPEEYPEQLIGEYLREASPDRFDLQRGSPLPDDWGSPRFQFDASTSELRQYDYLANSAMVPLVSSRLADLLSSEFRDSVQLIAAQVKTNDDYLHGYEVVNVTVLDRLIDLEASEYLCIPGTQQPMTFHKLVLHEGFDKDTLVRDRSYPGLVIVPDIFKAACTERGFKGLEFRLPKNFSQ